MYGIFYRSKIQARGNSSGQKPQSQTRKMKKSGIPILARTLASSGGRINIDLSSHTMTGDCVGPGRVKSAAVPNPNICQIVVKPPDFDVLPPPVPPRQSKPTVALPRDKNDSPAAKPPITPLFTVAAGKTVRPESVSSGEVRQSRSLTSPPRTPSTKNFTEAELEDLYSWVDQVPFSSKGKNNIHRDFSDGVRLAEVIHHFIPKAISLHNYSQASGRRAKIDNWEMLSRKVLKNLDIPPPKGKDMYELVSGKPGAIERVLAAVRDKISLYQNEGNASAAVDSSVPRPGGKFHIDFRERFGRRASRTTSHASTTDMSCSGVSGTGDSEWIHPFHPVIHEYHRRVAERKKNASRHDLDGRKSVFEDTCTVHAAYENKRGDKVAKVVDYVVYEGCHMVPESIVDAFQDELRTAVEHVKNIAVKVRRLETLVQLKENRLQDLTQEFHQLTLQVEENRKTKGLKASPKQSEKFNNGS